MSQANFVNTTAGPSFQAADARAELTKHRVQTADVHASMAGALVNLKAPVPPFVGEPPSETAWFLREQAKYLRAITEAIKPAFERAADDAADNGARIESFEIIEGAVEDFVAGFTTEAERLEEESRGAARRHAWCAS